MNETKKAYAKLRAAYTEFKAAWEKEGVEDTEEANDLCEDTDFLDCLGDLDRGMLGVGERLSETVTSLRYKQTMSFPTLAEFLALRDPTDSPPRKNTTPLAGEDWLWLYDRAKKTFEAFGDDGPLPGTQVTCYWAGHGGGPGTVRTFDGVFDRDPRFFKVFRMERGEKRFSLVERTQWWFHLYVGELPWRGPESIPWL